MWQERDDNCAILKKAIAAGADGILKSNTDGLRQTAWHPYEARVRVPRGEVSEASAWTSSEERSFYNSLVKILLCSDLVKRWINEPNQKGEIALHKAVQFCESETVKNMINNGGASVQYTNPQAGENVLHLAKTAEMIELLIANGAKIHINSPNLQGHTPFRKAVMEKRLNVAKALSQNGADTKIHDTIKIKLLSRLTQRK
ncbi:MAG: hypothetical protein C5B47_05275 [Verrucomicrobia bacterium]|nr:MAG: hypothetical protein C5B47_05275 [Verrucomicrobiota bacterium]